MRLMNMKPWKSTNLSEPRTLSDKEWLSTVPGRSGPLWVWRPFGSWVLVLPCTMSWPEVDASASLLVPFLFHPVFSCNPAFSISLSIEFPFLLKHSTCDNPWPLAPTPCSSWYDSLHELKFFILAWGQKASWQLQRLQMSTSKPVEYLMNL